MSEGAATQPQRSGRGGIAKLLLGLGLLATVLGTGLSAQPDSPSDVDDKRPFGPGEPTRALLAEKYRVPNPDRAIFKGRRDTKSGKIEGGIADLYPLASEKENADEYWALHEVFLHAKQFSAAELEEHAGRDLIRDDFIEERTRGMFRLDLVRFDGKLMKVRRTAPTKHLREAGVAEVYEATVVPLNEPPTDIISVFFTELPPELAAIKEKKEDEWLAVDSWAVVTGYFFKLKQDSAKGDAIDRVPVLLGKSISVRKEPPPSPDKDNPVAFDKNLRVLKFIRDDARIAKADDNWEEVAAWNRVLLHSTRFTPEEIEKHANWELRFADLFETGRRDYKLDPVGFEGRLIMLSKMKPSRKLEAAGVKTLYEGWLVPKNEPRGNPVCIVFSELPEGMEDATGRVNKWVAFAGYSFKLMRYDSNERDADGKQVTKRAPLLIGRAVTLRRDPDAPTGVTWRSFANTALFVILGVLIVCGGLTWWFRRGDKKAQQEIDVHRTRNPFGEQPGTT